jgi:hypothetical protein
LSREKLVFGKHGRTGGRVPFTPINGRRAVATSLGDLILDSGVDRFILFGVRPDIGFAFNGELRTSCKVWRGDGLAMPNRREPGADGLLLLVLFKAIIVCNSNGFVFSSNGNQLSLLPCPRHKTGT